MLESIKDNREFDTISNVKQNVGKKNYQTRQIGSVMVILLESGICKIAHLK